MRRATRSARPRAAPLPFIWTRFREVILAGAFLVALSTFQAEFDFGVPQFALALQPTLIMLAAGIGLVTAQDPHRPAAARSARCWSICRSAASLALLVGPLFGEITPHFPPYVAEALAVEAVALAFLRGHGRNRRWSGRSPSAPWPGSGSARSAWPPSGAGPTSGSSIPGPRPSSPRAPIAGLIAAIAAGLIGGFVGRCLTPGVERRERVPRAVLPPPPPWQPSARSPS